MSGASPLGGVVRFGTVFAGQDFFGDEAGILPDRDLDLGVEAGRIEGVAVEDWSRRP